MISHDFVQIAEGFRANDDDLIGSKLFNSPRSKGEFVPMKYSSSLENNRSFPSYAGHAIERSNPQAMNVITFTSELKGKGTSKSVIKSNERANNTNEENNKGNGQDGKEAAVNGKTNGKSGGENGKGGTKGTQEDGNGQENAEGAGKENGEGKGERIAKENDGGTSKEAKQEGKEGEEDPPAGSVVRATERSASRDPSPRMRSDLKQEDRKETEKGSDMEEKSREDPGTKNTPIPTDVPIVRIDPPSEPGSALPSEPPARPPSPSDPPSAEPPARVEPPVPVLLQVGPAPVLLKTVPAPAPNGRHKSEAGSKLLRSPQQPLSILHQQTSSEPFTFAKDMAFKKKPPVTNPSALAISLTERYHVAKNVKASKLQIPDYHVPCLQLIVFVLIHSSFLPNKLNNIRVPPNATVEHVIEVAVKKLNDLIEKHRPEDPPLAPARCQLVLAEEDGRPDTDTPVLQRDAAVHRFGCIYFALCKDPESEGVITADSKTFKVILPSKEYQVLSYKRSLSLGQVLEKVCSKRQLDPSVHYFSYNPNGKDVEINLDTLVSDLETSEVTMKCRISRKHTGKYPMRPPRSRSKNDVFAPSSEGHDSLAPPVLNSKLSRHLGVPKEFFWSPASVATYVQYTVIKINKYGKKQERIMGIDRERITNSMPVNKPNKTNRPARLMSDIIRAYIPDRPVPTSPSNRKSFCVEFKDNQIQEFESEKADEIVARINYIISLETPPKSRLVE